jgi:ribonuclease P protein component
MAFAVRRRTGSAVVRNRLRRRLRAIAAAVGLPAGAYLVRPTDRAAALGFDELTREFTAAVGRATGSTS